MGTKHQNFTHHIDVRLTEAEHTAITRAAAEHGLSASRFLAARAFTDRLPLIADREELVDAVFQLHRLGTNANQIARACNYARLTNGEAPITRQDFAELSSEARQAIRSIRKAARWQS